MSSDKPYTPRRRSSGAERPHQLAGLGIRNFPTIDQTSIDRDHEQEVTLPTKPAYGTYTGNTPSPQTRYSERLGSGTQGNGLMSPPSPGMNYPWAQHGSSMSKFKSQSQVPSSPRLPYEHKNNDDAHGPTTPTQRFGSFGSSPSSTGIVDAMSRRPTLMRTPPTDHPEFDPQEAEEEGDSILPDLPMSPARFALNSQFPRPDYTFGGNQDAGGDTGNVFGGGDLLSPGNMSSPRFGTYDPPLTPRNSLPHARNGSIGGVHGRNSSIGDGRVHARNLSLFFPQPGSVLQAPGSPRRGSTGLDAPVTDISGTGHKRPGLGSDGSFTFGRSAVPPPLENGEAKVVGRRGHHHKHSLSHNFFSFLDPTVTNPDLANLDAAPRPMPTNHVGGGGTRSSPNLASIPILPSPISNPKTSTSFLARLSSLSSSAKVTLAFGGAEFVLGAAIWVKGQSVGSVGLTGLGYLVVFDALGVWVKLWSEVIKSGEGSTSTAGRPFGAHRKESMLYFVQSIFLLFSATYIAKEALEIALMSGSGSGGGHSHGHALGHSHASGAGGEDQTDKPLMLLASGALAVLLSATSLGNHAKLVEAVGPAVMPLRLGSTHSKAVRPGGIGDIFETVDRLVGNPFSLAIFSCISVNLLGHIGLASQQVLKLERIMAFVEAGVAFWLAYPSSLVFGQVLLQTAPPEQAAQMTSFKRAISDIKDHPSVLRTNPPHIWQLTPHDPRPAASQRTSGKSDPIESTLQTCILVAELTVCVRDDLEDKAILNLTRFCYERCSEAIWTKSGRRMGDPMGEVTIAVKRERELEAEAAEEEKHEHDHDHHHHHHGHHHHHEHKHGKDDHHDHVGHHAHTHSHEHHDHDEKHEHDHHTHHDSCSHAH